MTIERDGRYRMIACESCSETLDLFDIDEFNAMIADAKAKNWTIRNEDGTWTHKCPDCSGGNRLQAARRFLG